MGLRRTLQGVNRRPAEVLMAVIGLTRTASREVIVSGLRVNAVCTAPIETPMGDLLESGLAPHARAALRA